MQMTKCGRSFQEEGVSFSFFLQKTHFLFWMKIAVCLFVAQFIPAAIQLDFLIQIKQQKIFHSLFFCCCVKSDVKIIILSRKLNGISRGFTDHSKMLLLHLKPKNSQYIHRNCVTVHTCTHICRTSVFPDKKLNVQIFHRKW